MQPDIGSANIRVGSTVQGLIDGMKRVSASVRSTVFEINNRLTDSYKRASKEQAAFRGGLSKLSGDLTDISKKMAIVGGLPALFAAGKAFKDYAELQKLQRGLERYGESIESVRELAKLPNIGIFDGAKALIGMKAMKLNSDLATRSLKAFANAITDAGGSAVDLEPALINLNQFVRGRHINQVDLRQLATRMPQTYDAMEAAFGTTEVEKLNAKMQSIGVTAFIDKFVKELEKIPFAGGGAANAMEQLSDATTFASAALGEGADKAFDITGKIAGLTNIVDNLTSNFQSLTPEAQKSIYAVGALAVGMPILIGAVGGLVKLLPLLATGFGAISAPITATIAVVGVAAAAIITNWDSVKKFLTDSTWWTTLTGLGKSTLGVLMESFKVVLNLIQGDWGNMWKALVNIGKNAANAIVDTIGGITKGALGLFGTFNEALGFDSMGRGMSSAVKYIDGLTQKFRFDVPDSFAAAGKAIDGVKGAMSKLGGESAALAPAAGDAAEYYEKMSKSAFKIWQIDLAGKWAEEREALKQKIKSYKELIGVTAALTLEQLKARSMEIHDKKAQLGDTVDGGRSRAKAMGAALMDSRMKETQQAISKSAAKYFGEGNLQFDAAFDLNSMFGSAFELDSAKNYFKGFSKAANESLTQYADRLRMILDVTAQFKDTFGSAFNLEDAKKFFKELPKVANQSGEKYAEEVRNIAQSTAQMNAAITSAVQGGAVDAFTTLGEKLGDSMSGLSGIGDKIYSIIGNLLVNIGKALITYNSVIQGLKVAIKSMNGYVALAAGVLAIAAGTVLKNKVGKMGETTRFAKGGFAYGEMSAIVGDNPNARHDPEMIAPYSKVDKSIEKSIKMHGGSGGVQVFIPRLEIENDKFYVAFKRSEVKYKALLGGR
ncbi:hypothetical protein [Dyadobacter fermentans]|uniref:Uncharacterized protein n=1 Tax=Dyadobacter fermentans (strain ATCC 700827 / DSM 18053 / CIP 107007 / KCTC 52180 / NS114) TaxID=471854 RepID=C6VVH8_DYAFD|nr:hypothetical protein [Dyadobacter fermentans]ACT96708.1 hypothetical protein Dfer_5517 [Dyadobacter fermentans DSM 18053]